MWRESDVAKAERNSVAAEEALYQAGIELDAAISARSYEIGMESMSSNAALCDALQEISYGEIDLLSVMMDEAKLGHLIKSKMLDFIAREARRAAEKEME